MQERRPILVAGKTGQLARCLVAQAALRGVRLVAVARPELDLADAESIARVVAAVAPRGIINAAAYTAVDQAESEPTLALALNRDGAARLAAEAARLRVPFIHLSTDYAFDGTKESAYEEVDAPAPLSAYGRSKLAGEIAVRDACPAAVVLRSSWLYSRFGRNFVTTMLNLAKTRDVVRVVDDQHGAPTAAADLAGAILTIYERMAGNGVQGRLGLYHLAATGETTWHGFAAAIFAGWEHRGGRVPALERISTAENPTPARRPANSRLDCTKIERAFGLRLPHWRDSLDRCLDDLAGAFVEAH
jgi:dTDP-4-dehydrorhamnose reductase